MQKELGLISQLLGSVTIDGWIVIALIAIVGLLSGDVLFTKLRQLNRAERGDRDFLGGFAERWAADGAQLAAGGTVAEPAASPLQRLYVRGLAELRTAQSQSADRRRIPGQYLGVIRSALDVGIVEETNALNQRLVLMTIAVSGAPFLGLLGTVVGVMITFASIAATGDVNVIPSRRASPPPCSPPWRACWSRFLRCSDTISWQARVAARVSAMDVFADQLLARFAAAFTGGAAAHGVARAA